MYDRAYIEISNACNLQCSFCPEVERTKKIMSPDFFESLIIQVKPIAREITLHLMGEPLSHPQFNDLISLAEKHETPITLTTNGTLLYHKDRLDRLLSPIFRQINFSVQSLYDNYPLEKALTTIDNILEAVDFYLKKRPELYINFRLWNLSENQSYQNSNHYLFERITKKWNLDFLTKIDIRRKKSLNLTGRLYLHFDSRFVWPSLTHPVVRDSGFCYALKSHFGVLADGTVVPCCLDKEAAIPLGKFTGKTNELVQILNSAKALKLKKDFTEHKVEEELCRRCTFINRFDRKSKPDLSSVTL